MAYATIQDVENTGILPKAMVNLSATQISAALDNASGIMDDFFNARYVLPLIPPYPGSLVQNCVNIAVWLFMRTRGYNPAAGGADQVVIRTSYEDSMRWLNDVANERAQPRVTDSSSNGGTVSQAPAVLSSPPRGWEWLPGYGYGSGGRGW